MNTLFALKTELDDFEVHYEILSPIDDSKVLNSRQLEISKEIEAVEAQLETREQRVAELDKEISRLTNHADGLDYTIAVASGILTGLIDAFFVGELGLFEDASADTKAQFRDAKGKSNEIVNKFVEKYAKMRGYKPKEDGNRLKGAITFLEEKFPVAQDNIWKGERISSTHTHHLDDLAHHPTLMGLVSAMLVQFFRISFFADKQGKWHPRIVETSIKDLSCWIPVIISGILKWLSYMAERNDLIEMDENLPESLQWLIKNIYKAPVIIQLAKVADTWFGHLVSDMGGSKSTPGGGMGVPGIFVSLLKEMSMLPDFKDTNLPKIVNDLYASKKYTTDKVDLRTEVAVVKEQAMPVIVNEVIVRTFYFVRHFISEYQKHNMFSEIDWQEVIPFGNCTVERMMTIATGTFVAVDVADAAIRSGGFNASCLLRVNFVGIGRFAIAIGTDVTMGIKKREAQRERSMLMSEIICLSNVKLYYKNADLMCSYSELYEKEATMHSAEADMWVEVDGTQQAMEELYEQIENVGKFYAKTIQAMDQNFDEIERLLPDVEKMNPGLVDEMLRRLQE